MMARQLSKMQKIIDEVRPNLVVIARSHCHPFYRPRAGAVVINNWLLTSAVTVFSLAIVTVSSDGEAIISLYLHHFP